MNPERRYCELRTEGRTFEGEALVYGDEAVFSWGRERIEPGAFAPVGDVILNRQHDRKTPLARTGGGGLELNDTPEALRIHASLPETEAANDTLTLVRAKILRGLSIEFHATAERGEGDLRIIEKARLVGVAVVDEPQYPQSLVQAREAEMRAKRLRTIRGSIPAKQALECRCSPGDCVEAVFESGALDDAIDPEQAKDALAVVGEYANAIGSRKRRSLRFWSDGEGGLQYALDIPDTARGRALLETMDAADVIGRPVVDAGASEFVLEAGRATYTKAHVRALTIGPTDASAGWTPIRFKSGAGDDAPGAAPQRRRTRLWL
ncbi:MAG: HK97 family phage prohead protease [Nitrospinae bacterium]|nr:HK97 family phage prohead protease [Nitrospinota bacterium]